MRVQQIENAFSEMDFNEKLAESMSACIKNEFPYYGIKRDARRAEQKRLLVAFGLPHLLAPLIKAMWSCEHREIQLFAMDLLIMAKEQKRTQETELFSRQMMHHLLTTRPQWDTVDIVASEVLSHHIKLYPDDRESLFDEWLASGNVWLIRALVLHQTKAKGEELDEGLLFDLVVRANDASKDAWVQKAIARVLRDHSLVSAEAVRKFVEKRRAGVANPLPRNTVKAALKHLDAVNNVKNQKSKNKQSGGRQKQKAKKRVPDRRRNNKRRKRQE